MKFARIAIALFALSISSVPVWAQCSLCKLAVEQDPSLGTAFNKAILLMMVPALAVFAGVFLLAVRSNGHKDTKTPIDYGRK